MDRADWLLLAYSAARAVVIVAIMFGLIAVVLLSLAGPNLSGG